MQNFWVRRWELYCTQHHNLQEYSCCLGSFSSVLPMNIKKRCPVHTAHAIVLLHNWFKLQCQRIWILSKALLPCLWPKGTHCIYLPILVAVPALSCSVVSDSLPPHRLSSTRLLCPWGFSRQKYWSGLLPSSSGYSYPRIESSSPAFQADSLPSEPPGKPKNTGACSLSLFQGIFLTQELNQVFALQVDSLPPVLPGKPVAICYIYVCVCVYIYIHISLKRQNTWQSVSLITICKCMREYEVFLKIL